VFLSPFAIHFKRGKAVPSIAVYKNSLKLISFRELKGIVK